MHKLLSKLLIRWLLGLFALSSVVGIAAWTKFTRSLPPPQLRIGEPRISAGRIHLREEGLTFRFKLENWGGQDLVIYGTYTSCGCTSATLSVSDQ